MNLLNALYRTSLMPVSRWYAKFVLKDSPADATYRFLCSFKFRQTHGFWPDFAHPRRFTEKLWSRMLHDRDPQWTLLCDKLEVREFVTAKIGGDWLVPLLWSGESPEQIPFDDLPPAYVLKTTHGCANNIFVRPGAPIDRVEIRRQLSEWLKFNYGTDFLLGIEWGYKHIKPRVIAEAFLEEAGTVPLDYKFYCFGGRVEFLTQHFGRLIQHKTRSFDRNYEPHEFRYQFDQFDGPCPRPKNFDEMVRLAETLAEDFEFMRVDLYNIDGRIYFGEMTPYPGGVSTQFLPDSLDFILGEKWAYKAGAPKRAAKGG